jgi:nucleoside-diphosphate-sugar epimerase
VKEPKHKIAVSGVSGLVGRGLVAQLVALGWIDVLALTRQSLPNPIGGATYVSIGDLSSLTEWHATLVGVNTVIHCAARVHVMKDNEVDPLTAFRAVNVDGTLNFARQAAIEGVKRFVFISSVKVNGESTQPGRVFTEADAPDPKDAYGQSKREAEQGLRQLAADTGMEVVIIRPPLVYGPGVKANFAALMRAVQRRIPLPLAQVRNHRNFVGLGNLVDFIMICATHPKAANETFLVSDGQALSTPELIRQISIAAGVPARLWPLPVWVLQVVAGLLGKGDVVQRICGNLQVDISKARNLLGWAPVETVQEGLKRAMKG